MRSAPTIATIIALSSSGVYSAPLDASKLNARQSAVVGDLVDSFAKPVAGSIAGGLTALGVTAAINDLKKHLESHPAIKRELEARQSAALADLIDSFAKPVAGSIAGGVTALGVTAAINDIKKHFASNSATKRELDARQSAAVADLIDSFAKPVAGSVAGGLTALGVTAAINDLKKHFGSTSSAKRELDARQSAAVADLIDSFAKPVAGSIASGVTALGVTAAINDLKKHFESNSPATAKRGYVSSASLDELD
ncbi:hypothetical protein BD410DRAFT_823959 [Rickenella mellea]|uniref:Uncharacterized protein n=1 Tax=Rickenella mellea TaxID=50990 RepID=A0A4R5XGU2_9AGAM|nr:hypothetical protein BD410DRAFT_823959 [Rickenella mellea]